MAKDAGGLTLHERTIPLGKALSLAHILDTMQRQMEGFYDDFHGSDIGAAWVLNDTSSAGAPTHAPVDGSHVVLITLAADDEAEVVGYDFGDVLTFDIDNGPVMIAKIKTTDITTAEGVVVGLGAAWNDTLDSNVAHAWFRLIASMDLVVETDANGAEDNDDVATGVTMVAAEYKWLKIDATDSTDVKFYVSDDGLDWTRVATSTTFDMSNYTAGLQPMFAIVKSGGTTTPTLTVDKVSVVEAN